MGAILGRKRAFTIGCVIYACGSLTTALSPNLAVLMFGWSFLEGVGAALVMPAIVALVASNFVKPDRPRRLRHRRRRRRDRGGGRPADRRAVHDVLVVALRVRRRGAHHRRGPAPQPAHRRHAQGGRRPPRPRRHGPLGARAGPDRLRRPALGDVGLRATEAGRADLVGPVAGDLADPRRRRGAVRVPRLGEAPARHRPSRRCSIPRSCGSGCCAAGSSRSSSSTCSRPGCSSRCRCSSRSRSGSPRSRPACGSCRSRSPWSSPRSGSPSCSRRRRRDGSASSGSSPCSSVSSCSSPRSTRAPVPRSSPGRCSSPGSASARSPHNSVR